MDKFERAKKFLEIANENRPTTKEVADFAVQIINTVKEVQKTLKSDMDSGMKGCEKMCKDVENSLGSLENKLTALISKSSKESNDKAYKDLNNEVYKLEKLISDIPQFDSTPLESKFGFVIKSLESKIDEWKQLNAFDVRDLVESLTGDDRISKNAIKGIDAIEEQIKSIELRPVGGRGTSVGIQLYVDGVRKGRVSTVNLVAGSGITLAHTTSGQRNDILITAGGSSAFTKLTATGTVDGSNTSFTFTTAPQIIVVDGRAQQKTQSDGTVNWTGTTSVTLTIAPQFDIYAY